MEINTDISKQLNAGLQLQRKFKILVVDDNVQNIQLMGNLLKTSGYSVGFATEGRQAISILTHANDYDLILLDVDMPVLNGIETCKLIREDCKLRDIPIIFLTAFTDEEKILAGFKAGAQDYVTKPFNSNELLARVNTHLQLKYKSEQLMELNRTLEKKVEERTQALVEANQKLARLDKAKSDFLILISHEMRTPLNGIVGLAELLKDSNSNDASSEYIDYLVVSAEKLLKFSDSALLITHLQLQEEKISRNQEDLKKLLQDVLHEVKDKIEAKHLSIRMTSETDDLLVSIDRDLFEVSLKSLLENAINFSPIDGEINIKTNFQNGIARVSIIDQGPGFSKEALERSFEVFSAADMAHHSEGFGLSLATVKLIMDIHKGSIEIRNDVAGAEVSLFLPIN